MYQAGGHFALVAGDVAFRPGVDRQLLLELARQRLAWVSPGSTLPPASSHIPG